MYLYDIIVKYIYMISRNFFRISYDRKIPWKCAESRLPNKVVFTEILQKRCESISCDHFHEKTKLHN